MSDDIQDRYQRLLDDAITARRTRGYWSGFRYHADPEPDDARNGHELARSALTDHRSMLLRLAQPTSDAEPIKAPASPYGPDLGLRYPRADIDALVSQMSAAHRDWSRLSPRKRGLICAEILSALSEQRHLLAHLVMHSAGRGYGPALDHDVIDGLDRALEAVACALSEMEAVPEAAEWRPPSGPVTRLPLRKTYHVVSRGLGLVIAGRSRGLWCALPGLFASLVCGNPVLVKPHPAGIPPLGLVVQTAQQVLAAHGFPGCLVALVVDDAEAPIGETLATLPDVRLIDYTGTSGFAGWLLEHANQADIFTLSTGVNPVIVDSTNDLASLVADLAHALCLSSGQTCTRPQNIFIPQAGIDTDTGPITPPEFGQALASAIHELLIDRQGAAELLGVTQGDEIVNRIMRATMVGELVLASEILKHPEFPEAQMRSPLIMTVDAAAWDTYAYEWVGPVNFLVTTRDTEHSLALAMQGTSEQGALHWTVYTTDENIIERTTITACDSGVHVNFNLAGAGAFDKGAAFSDYHGTGANPSGNACLVDSAFVTRRFRVVETRRAL